MKLIPEPDEYRFYGFNAFTIPVNYTVAEYLQRWHVGLSDDLYWCAFKEFQLINARQNPSVIVQGWPLHKPKMFVYWSNSQTTNDFLNSLSDRVQTALTPDIPQEIGRVKGVRGISESFESVGRTIAAISYAIHTHKVAEIYVEGRSPLYVARDSPTHKLLTQHRT